MKGVGQHPTDADNEEEGQGGGELTCHGLAISKTGIKLGRNKKRGSSAAKFSLLTALADLHDFSKDPLLAGYMIGVLFVVFSTF